MITYSQVMIKATVITRLPKLSIYDSDQYLDEWPL